MGARVYISHADEDKEQCERLAKVLGEWQIPCYYDATDRHGGQALNSESQRALVNCDVMLRVCTRNTNRSYWMSIEAGALLALQADDHRAGQDGRHKIINLILDKSYKSEPFDINSTVIDATYSISAVWVNDLRRALDLAPLMDIAPVAERINPPPPPKVSRRAVVGFSIAGAILLAGGVAGGYRLLQAKPAAKRTPPSPDARLKWWYLAGDPGVLTKGDALIVASPVVSGNAIYLGNTQGQTLALAQDGKKLWGHALSSTSGIYQRPVVLNGVMYFAAHSDGLYAVQNGAIVWAHNAAFEGTFIFTRLLIADGKLFVNSASEGAFVSAYDVATGKALLQLEPSTSTIATSGVAVSGNLVYAGAEDGFLYALDMTNPKAGQVWSAKVGAAANDAMGGVATYYVNSSIVIDNGTVYAASLDNNIYAFDATTGVERWVYNGSGAFSTHAPVIADGVLYAVSQDRVLHAVDAGTGALRWKNASSNASSPALVDNGVVYVGSHQRAIHALDAATGALKSAYKTASLPFAQPSIADSTLYVADSGGYVYAFSLT